MKKFNKLFRVGTKVKIEGIKEYCTVKKIDESRKWIEIEKYLGKFQRVQVEKFTNKR